MQAYYFDTSSLVKRYVEERGSEWVRSILEPPAIYDAYSATLTRVEVSAAFARRLRAGSLTPAEASNAASVADRHLRLEFRLLAVSDNVIGESIALANRHGLRAYDAVHLAVATLLQRARDASGLAPITLVSADTELNEAALAEGLLVEDPNTHI